MIITNILLFSIAYISILGFWKKKYFDNLIFSPSLNDGFFPTAITSCFVHSGWVHLALNLLCLYFLGYRVESHGHFLYIIILFFAFTVPLLPSYFIHKKDGTFHCLEI